MQKSSKAVRYTANVARILLGLVFFVFGILYFFMPMPSLDPTTQIGQFSLGLIATGYFFPFLKSVEIVCGFMLFFKRTTPLALIVLAPIVINILLVGIFLDQQGLIMVTIITLLTIFLGWYNFEKYENIFKG